MISFDACHITSVIQNGVNGYALPLEANSKDYVLKIEPLLLDKQQLQKLAVSSKELYTKELNWNVWAKKMSKILTFTHQKK